MRRLLCSLRGGHRWATTHDAAGSVAACTRCRTLRHTRVESVAHGRFKVHTNMGATFVPLPEHGAEELDVDER